MSAPRIAVFGGSFDPVHNAHIALARRALDQLQLTELLWVPAGQPWQKQRAITPAVHHEAMVRLAIDGEPRFGLSRIEIERSGPSYTIDTVIALQAARPGAQWFLVIGQDQYAGFHTWQGWQELLDRTTLAIAARPDAGTAAEPRLSAAVHAAVALPMMDVSSTEIRERIRLGLGIADLVPPAVASYIARHHLYQDPPQGDPARELNGHS